MPLLICSGMLAETIYKSPRRDRKKGVPWAITFFYASFAINVMSMAQIFGSFNEVYRVGFLAGAFLGVVGVVWSTRYLKKAD
jgi:hypothetical protein